MKRMRIIVHDWPQVSDSACAKRTRSFLVDVPREAEQIVQEGDMFDVEILIERGQRLRVPPLRIMEGE